MLVGIVVILWAARELRRRLAVWNFRRRRHPALAANTAPEGRDVAQGRKELERLVRQLDGVGRWWKRRRSLPPPWFVLIGCQGSGKSSLMERLQAVKVFSVTSSTARLPRMQYWQSSEGIFVEVSGSEPGGLPTEDEMAELARLLGKRQAEPCLNGAIVTVSAEKLQGGDLEYRQLLKEAAGTRALLDRISDAAGVHFPIYVIATKADVVGGFHEWISGLPSLVSRQPFGWLAGGSNQTTTSSASVAKRVITLTLASVKMYFRLVPEQLLFERTFSRLAQRLEAVAGETARPKRDGSHHCFLRGVFLCSAAGIQLGEDSQVVHVAPGGVFVASLAHRIAVLDARLARTFRASRPWWRDAERIALAAWWSCCGVAIVFIVWAFLTSFGSLTVLRDRYPRDAKVSQLAGRELIELAKYRNVLDWIREGGVGRSAASVIFGGSPSQIEQAIERDFVERFRNFMHRHVDASLDRNISLNAPRSAIGAYVELMSWRISLLDARLNGNPQDVWRIPTMGREIVAELLLTDPQGLPPEEIEAFYVMYRHYVTVETDIELLRRERDILSRWLNLLVLSAGDMGWIVAWANGRPDVSPITLNRFWGEQLRDTVPKVIVPPAYTKQGMLMITDFGQQISRLIEPSKRTAFAVIRDDFERQYQRQRLGVWYAALARFDTGAEYLSGSTGWRVVLDKAMTPEGPHFAFLRTVEEELADYKSDSPYVAAPAWLALVRQINAIFGFAMENEFVGGSAWATIGRRALREAVSSGPRNGLTVWREQSAAIKAARTYLAELNEVWRESATGQGSAYKVAVSFTRYGKGEDSSNKQGQPRDALKALADVKRLFKESTSEVSTVWKLVEAPAELLLTFAMREAACEVQREWTERVIAAIESSNSRRELAEILFGETEDGALTSFVKDVAAPFIAKSDRGYVEASIRGGHLGLNKDLFVLLNRADYRAKRKQDRLDTEVRERWDKIEQSVQEATISEKISDIRNAIIAEKKKTNHITIQALPTDVNLGSVAYPYSVGLTIQCANGPLSLNNLNHHAILDMTWRDDDCSSPRIEIRIADISLIKKYDESNSGVLAFMRDFRSGEYVFRSEDFPTQRSKLADLGVSEVRVRYKIAGIDDAMEHAERLANLLSTELELTDQKRRLQRDANERQISRLWEIRQNVSGGAEDRLAVPAELSQCWKTSFDNSGDQVKNKGDFTQLKLSKFLDKTLKD